MSSTTEQLQKTRAVLFGKRLESRSGGDYVSIFDGEGYSMLPDELGKLSAALASTAAATTLDPQRLGAELTGLATFHRELFDQDLLTSHQKVLLQEKWYINITAPPGGPPAITAPPEGPPVVVVGGPVKHGTGPVILCPFCQGKGTVTL